MNLLFLKESGRLILVLQFLSVPIELEGKFITNQLVFASKTTTSLWFEDDKKNALLCFKTIPIHRPNIWNAG